MHYNSENRLKAEMTSIVEAASGSNKHKRASKGANEKLLKRLKYSCFASASFAFVVLFFLAFIDGPVFIVGLVLGAISIACFYSTWLIMHTLKL